jgi:thioredoxin-dependent peroxiredoxin
MPLMKSPRNAAFRTVPFLFLAIALLALAYTSIHAPVLQADDAVVPAVGASAPDFTLNSQEGTPINLHDYRGKWVVLYFYPKDMTPGCTIEAHSFQNDLDKYQQINTVILGVSVDSVDSHKQFCAKDGLNFKLLSDETHEVVAKYGSTMIYGTMTIAARNTFLIDPKGNIVWEKVKVNPQGHSAEVLAVLADLQKGAK